MNFIPAALSLAAAAPSVFLGTLVARVLHLPLTYSLVLPAVCLVVAAWLFIKAEEAFLSI